MAGESEGSRRPAIFAVVAVTFLIAGVCLHDDSTPKVEDLLSLQQSGNGLKLPSAHIAWDISEGTDDARLSDQVAHWTGSHSKHGEVLKAAAATQQLSEETHTRDGATKLKEQMHSAAQQLRLANFLSGVKEDVTDKQVATMYSKLDPKDTTGWKERMSSLLKPSKKAQLKQIVAFKRDIEHKLSTTSSQDSPAAHKMRMALKELLERKKKLQASISAEEDEVLKEGGHPWVIVKPDPANTEDVIDRLARREDAKSTFRGWINGQNGAGSAHKKLAVQARTQALSELKKADGSKNAARDSDLIASAQRRFSGRDTPMSIQERAAEKVAKWMGTGYVPIYG